MADRAEYIVISDKSDPAKNQVGRKAQNALNFVVIAECSWLDDALMIKEALDATEATR